MQFRYPRHAILADYARSSVGVALVGFVATNPMPLVLAAIFTGLSMPFLAYGARTVLRHVSTYRLDEAGLTIVGPWPKRLDWAALSGLRLRYYAIGRNRQNGWMELTLTAERLSLKFESKLDGFDDLLAEVATIARTADLALDPMTVENLIACDLMPDDGRRLPTPTAKPRRHPLRLYR